MIAVSVEEMRKLEIDAQEKLNIPSVLLMENAAFSFVSALKSEISVKGKSVCVICGKGNNGGDGYAIARLLYLSGALVSVYSVCDTALLSGDAKINFDIVKAMEIPFVKEIKNSEIIVDAIFGTGFHGTVDDNTKNIIDKINQSGSYVASVDIPSGLSAANGQGNIYVKSDLCVTFGYAKIGHFLNPAKSSYKKLVIAPISIPESDSKCHIITDKTFLEIPKRSKNSHKGTFGKALAFVGSNGMAGAAILSGSAILKSGAGMATVATSDCIISSIAHHFPSVMTYPLPTENDELCQNAAELIKNKSKGMNSLLIGCGLGQSLITKKTVLSLIETVEIPMVIDADGLNILSQDIGVLNNKKADIILTPHITEFSRLSGYSVSQVKENPVELAKEFSKKYNVTVILKDAVTVIAHKGEETFICPAENSGMATAGSGDVLAGVAAGLLAQGMTPMFSAELSAYIHSAAGRIAADSLGEYGMTSTDILNCIPKAFVEKKNITPYIKEL